MIILLEEVILKLDEAKELLKEVKAELKPLENLKRKLTSIIEPKARKPRQKKEKEPIQKERKGNNEPLQE